MGARIILIALGAEFFSLFRVAPGRGFACVLVVSLALKNLLFQHWPVPPLLGGLVYVSSALSVLWLFISMGMMRQNIWHGGATWLSLGAASKRTTFHTIEGVVTLFIVVVSMIAILPKFEFQAEKPKNAWDIIIKQSAKAPKPQREVIPPFVPVWELTKLNRKPPVIYTKDRWLEAFILGFIAMLGVFGHGMRFDWPESAEYQEIMLQQRREAARARGDMNFSDVEDVR